MMVMTTRSSRTVKAVNPRSPFSELANARFDSTGSRLLLQALNDADERHEQRDHNRPDNQR